MDNRIVSYAQNREDVILAAFFDENEKGFYVDVGANHPILDSVTRYFYERGWTGINIEPIKVLHELLEQDRPADINLKLGVSDKPGKLKLRIYDKGDGLSTFSDTMKGDYEAHESYFTDKFHEDLVEVKTLKQIFDENKVEKISFLKVDVEGYELEVLKGNDWAKYRPEVICIEANHVINDWHPLLKEHGYSKVFNDGLNEYFVAKEAQNRKEHFSYVKGLIGRPIISLKWNEELAHNKTALRRVELELQTEKSKTWEAQREVVHLQTQLQEQLRIRNLVKTLLRKIDASIYGRIEALNKPKRKHASKLIPIKRAAIEIASSRADLLEVAKENDHANFYSTSNTGAYSKLYGYKISKFIYKFTRKCLKFFFKALRKIVRSVRRRPKS
jgi:FkbM family methyltransferase